MKVAANPVNSRLTPLSVGQIPDDWQVVPLKALASSIRNGFVGVSLDHQTDQSGVRYLQGFNIRPNRIDLTNETYVTPEFAKKHKKARLTTGDILTVQSGHIGTTAMVTPDLEGAKAQPHHEAGVHYGAIKRKARMFQNISLGLETDLNALRRELDELVASYHERQQIAPPIPAPAYWITRRGVRNGEHTYNEPGEKK